MVAMEKIERNYTVTALTAELKSTLENKFNRIYLEGEITGWKRPSSGHCYFSLKDSAAVMSAVMYISQYERCKAKDKLRDGAKVLVYGTVTIYPPSGKYQFNVLAAKLLGNGDLMQRYLDLKAKLEAEGLFDAGRKRPLPKLPRRIGIVTSESGAVIHDMCTVLFRRFPFLHVCLFPSQVQGADAPPTLIAGLEYFRRNPPDLVIIARGGGSYEDLFCFNDETLVRTVAAFPVPIISAVGHETDFTLCDFAADKRAGTPSIAAEMAVPLFSELSARLADLTERLATALRSRGEYAAQRVDHLEDAMQAALRLATARSAARVEQAHVRLAPALRMAVTRSTARVEQANARLAPALRMAMLNVESRLARAGDRLNLLSPYGVLNRGYAIVTDEKGLAVRDADALAAGDALSIKLAKGTVAAKVAGRRKKATAGKTAGKKANSTASTASSVPTSGDPS